MKKFIPFLIANYPNILIFKKRLKYLLKKNIKTIEIGIPHLDSYSDGKIISNAYRKINRFSINKFLKVMTNFKKLKKIIVCYSDFIENIGINNFLKKIKNKNYSLLIIDQPIKYILKIKEKLIKNNVKIVYITYIKKKIKEIKKIVSILKKHNLCSYIYLTNRLGVTGNNYKINYNYVKERFKKISKITKIKIIIGFGINEKNLDFYKKNRINFVIGTEIIKNIKSKKKFKKIIKKCLK